MTRKTAFFEGWSWFKFNNLGLALGTNLKFYTSVAKGLKLKVRKFWGLIPTFVEVTWEKPIIINNLLTGKYLLVFERNTSETIVKTFIKLPIAKSTSKINNGLHHR